MMVPRLLSIATTCDIAQDPAQNTRNHQDMLDKLNAAISADGWPGVSITEFSTGGGFASLQIEPGEAELTLELLRAFKEERRQARLKAAGQPEQRALAL